MLPYLLHRFSIPAFLLVLWVPLVVQLGYQWSVFEQYHYGWVVPLFSLFLLLHKWREINPGMASPPPSDAPPPRKSEPLAPRRPGSPAHRRIALFLLFAAAFLLLPVRLLHESNPMWRLTSWAWALLAVVITLCTVYLVGGTHWLRRLSFSIAFFLVAVPWPSPIEIPVVQALSRATAAIAVEILSALGVSVSLNSNVIEIGATVIGLQEVCSGIRSLQATLMIALFLGELYWLTFWKRTTCVLAGFGLAFAFNTVRATFLTWVAARHGVMAISKYHDSAGFLIVLGCFCSLYLIVLAMRPEAVKQRIAELIVGDFPEPPNPPDANPPVDPTAPDPWRRRLGRYRDTWGRFVLLAKTIFVHFLGCRPDTPTLPQFTAAAKHRTTVFLLLLAWLPIVSAGIGLWYHLMESSRPPPARWSVELPTKSTDFSTTPISERLQHLLWLDAGTCASWSDDDRNQWMAIHLRWNPGQTAAHLARFHTPDVCLPAAGWEFKALDGVRRLGPLDPPLPFRAYRIQDDHMRTGYVFYCRSGDRRDNETEEGEKATRADRLRALWRGRSNQGMTVLEIVVWGIPDELQAQAAVDAQLRKMLKSDKQTLKR